MCLVILTEAEMRVPLAIQCGNFWCCNWTSGNKIRDLLSEHD